MKVAIVDDEPLARARLRSLLDEIGGIEIAGEAGNGQQALELSESAQPDVMLLDIRMPGIDGLEVAGHLAALERPPAVIFTTACGDHALEAFEAHAVDYLLKPIRRQRLEEALKKARRLNHAELSAAREAGPQGATERTHICARVRGRLLLIPVAEIAYFRADQKYVAVRYLQGEALIEEPLKELEQEFSGRFLRVHRNTLVAMSFLTSLEKTRDGIHVIGLRGVADRPEVSRRHLSELKELLRRYA